MNSPELREQPVAQLVRFVIGPDGATMSCGYCQAESQVHAQNVPGQILRFQEAHFGCDPSLRALPTPRCRLPCQLGTASCRGAGCGSIEEPTAR